MKIEIDTKYNVGDKVYYLYQSEFLPLWCVGGATTHTGSIAADTIKEIKIDVLALKTYVCYVIDTYTCLEENVFINYEDAEVECLRRNATINVLTYSGYR